MIQFDAFGFSRKSSYTCKSATADEYMGLTKIAGIKLRSSVTLPSLSYVIRAH